MNNAYKGTDFDSETCWNGVRCNTHTYICLGLLCSFAPNLISNYDFASTFQIL
jgi:hypothetical protein